MLCPIVICKCPRKTHTHHRSQRSRLNGPSPPRRQRCACGAHHCAACSPSSMTRVSPSECSLRHRLTDVSSSPSLPRNNGPFSQPASRRDGIAPTATGKYFDEAKGAMTNKISCNAHSYGFDPGEYTKKCYLSVSYRFLSVK